MIKQLLAFKKTFAMYGASFIAVLLGFIISILNTKVLGPEKFGDFKYIETVVRLIASLVSVGFFISITRLIAINNNAVKEKKYLGLFVVILSIISAVGVLLVFIYSFIEPLFFKETFGSTFRTYFFIVPAIIANLALLEILKGLHKIYTLALLTIIPLIAYAIVAYTISATTTLNVNNVLLLYYGLLFITTIIVLITIKPNFNYKKSLVKELYKENKHNGRPIYYGSLAGVATANIAGICISYFLNDNKQVGFFMLALTVCSPLLIIPSVMGTTYFKQFVHLPKIPTKVVLFSIAVTAFALVIFYSLIDYVVIQFYSKDYLPVANIAKFLILGFIFHGLGDLINRFLGAKGEGKKLRNAAFFVGAINILGYTLLIKYFQMNGAIITKILASCLYLIVMLYYYINFIKKNKHV
ncbi:MULTISPECIES: lipopolysaccharide biosynthesis protein [unclassified Cellulophaga]|uniref:lipopolysaccharide biosynthesis protein n=1 Tax=unclassified Cellulophaga TaxID=2634405 RepID=UPI0026E336B2|nr:MULTISPECIES: oligosaccharide flippase family protein [unclassified Cellulophaga]MDO6491479.1 oligosaccharide flippase family protein [Cellulophaga sp. 2_MG-2023]MDO6493356.1 oligosaccharide flippase family protein [Cellulophaga sp. 3_MG-2023]